MPSNTFIPYEMKTSVLRVSRYQDQNLSGRVYNSSFEQEKPFASTTQMLLLLEQLHDELSFPQKAVNERSFGRPASVRPAAAGAAAEPVLASFKITIMFRQNASWQGTLIWLEQKSEAHFRSVLELIKLMDSALEDSKKRQP